jgi:GAF domain-containing protein
MSRRLLCVDPDERAREDTAGRLADDLSDLDVAVGTAGTLAAAEAALDGKTVAVVTEYDLADGTGLELVRAAETVCPDAGCVLYTDADPGRIETDDLRGSLTEYVGKESAFGSERLSRLVRTTVTDRVGASYPVPQSEAERLSALRSYDLDQEALRSSLDRVTTLAARHFGVDVASINIIGEHSQEFLACHGPAEDWEATAREDSICTFTILEDDGVMTVEDVTEDPRFASRSGSLVGMGIRSYMGANLTTNRGLVIGSLCVYDDEPRSFAPDDGAYLQELAATAMDLVGVHGRLEAPGSQGGGR